MQFIVAYDICHPRRLKQVAKRLEQSAVRVQKSVFLYEGSRTGLDAVCGDLVTLIDIHEDRVQAWGVHESHPTSVLDGATGHPSHALCVAVSPTAILVLGRDE